MMMSVPIDGVSHRFCQKCCRFHSDLNSFEGSKRCALASPFVPIGRPLAFCWPVAGCGACGGPKCTLHGSALGLYASIRSPQNSGRK